MGAEMRSAWPAAAIMLATATGAQAGVIYNWQEVTPDARFGSFTGQLEFFDHVWSADGGTSARENGNIDLVPIDHVPIESIAAAFSTEDFNPQWQFSPCGDDPVFCGDPDELILRNNEFNISVQFGDYLTNGLFLWTDDIRNFRMSYYPSDGLWHFEDIGSDPTNRSCFGDGGCTGTGRWVLQAQEVPEPSALALIGLAGAWWRLKHNGRPTPSRRTAA
jgi:hypothetical protein